MSSAAPSAAVIATGRLILRPVGGGDLPDLIALKADPRVFAVMLGGVRRPEQTAAELAADIAFWGKRGIGMWSVRRREDGGFVGIAGIMERPDGRGLAVRFALWPEARGQGLAREAAAAVLRFAHERAGIPRLIGVARADNFASRMVLGGIGMREADRFQRDGHEMVVYVSEQRGAFVWRGGGHPPEAE
jgi:RimJ/RimL family protein N-acetyltransferase